MAFSRSMPALLRARELDNAMRSIGMRLGAATRGGAPGDLELTLASTAASALPGDYRVLGVLLAWLEVHHARVNVPRLARILAHVDKRPVFRAFWAAVGHWLASTDARFRVLERLYRSASAIDLDDHMVTELQLQRVGPDPRFEGSVLRVHAKLLRSRPADVDDAVQLASRHPVYLKRLQLGPTYRADVWAALDDDPTATPATIARRVGCAYETARAVAEDWTTARLATQAA